MSIESFESTACAFASFLDTFSAQLANANAKPLAKSQAVLAKGSTLGQEATKYFALLSADEPRVRTRASKHGFMHPHADNDHDLDARPVKRAACASSPIPVPLPMVHITHKKTERMWPRPEALHYLRQPAKAFLNLDDNEEAPVPAPSSLKQRRPEAVSAAPAPNKDAFDLPFLSRVPAVGHEVALAVPAAQAVTGTSTKKTLKELAPLVFTPAPQAVVATQRRPPPIPQLPLQKALPTKTKWGTTSHLALADIPDRVIITPAQVDSLGQLPAASSKKAQSVLVHSWDAIAPKNRSACMNPQWEDDIVQAFMRMKAKGVTTGDIKQFSRKRGTIVYDEHQKLVWGSSVKSCLSKLHPASSKMLEEDAITVFSDIGGSYAKEHSAEVLRCALKIIRQKQKAAVPAQPVQHLSSAVVFGLRK